MLEHSQKYLRGQVWWSEDVYEIIDEFVANNSLQKGRRPVLIVSNDENNYHCRTVNVLPLTTAEKAKLPIHVNFFFNQNQTALSEQIKTIPSELMKVYMFSLSDTLMGSVENAMAIQLGIRDNNKMSMDLKGLENVVNKIAESKFKDLGKVLVDDDFILEFSAKLDKFFDGMYERPIKVLPKLDSTELINSKATEIYPGKNTSGGTGIYPGKWDMSDLEGEDPPTIKPTDEEIKVKRKYIKHEKVLEKETVDNGGGEKVVREIVPLVELAKSEGKVKWTDEMKRQLIHDKETMPISAVKSKWDFPTIKRVSDLYYNFRVQLGVISVGDRKHK